MSDLISRSKAIEEISRQQTYKMFEGEDTVYFDANDVGSVLASLPSAQPDRKTGRWIDFSMSIKGVPTEACGECGEWSYGMGKNYCPNCGSYNRGEL